MSAAAGPALAASIASKSRNVDVGSSLVADSYGLEAQGVNHVLHAIVADADSPGAYPKDGHRGQTRVIRSATTSCLAQMVAVGATSIAFPALGTGIGVSPKMAATEMAYAIREFLLRHDGALQVDIRLRSSEVDAEAAHSAQFVRSFTEEAELDTELRRTHLVILVHGIRTVMKWRGPVSRAMREADDRLDVRAISYGRFGLPSMIFPRTRQRPIDLLAKRIAEETETGDFEHVSAIAHSFGTYALGQALLQDPELRLHRIITVGSVLPKDFPDRLRPNQLTSLGDRRLFVNEHSFKDRVCKSARFLRRFGFDTPGYDGFGTTRVYDCDHALGHSGYFKEQNGFAARWAQIVATGDVPVHSPVPARTKRQVVAPTLRWLKRHSVRLGAAALAALLTFVVIQLIIPDPLLAAEVEQRASAIEAEIAERDLIEAERLGRELIEAKVPAELEHRRLTVLSHLVSELSTYPMAWLEQNLGSSPFLEDLDDPASSEHGVSEEGDIRTHWQILRHKSRHYAYEAVALQYADGDAFVRAIAGKLSDREYQDAMALAEEIGDLGDVWERESEFWLAAASYWSGDMPRAHFIDSVTPGDISDVLSRRALLHYLTALSGSHRPAERAAIPQAVNTIRARWADDGGLALVHQLAWALRASPVADPFIVRFMADAQAEYRSDPVLPRIDALYSENHDRAHAVQVLEVAMAQPEIDERWTYIATTLLNIYVQERRALDATEVLVDNFDWFRHEAWLLQRGSEPYDADFYWGTDECDAEAAKLRDVETCAEMVVVLAKAASEVPSFRGDQVTAFLNDLTPEQGLQLLQQLADEPDIEWRALNQEADLAMRSADVDRAVSLYREAAQLTHEPDPWTTAVAAAAASPDLEWAILEDWRGHIAAFGPMGADDPDDDRIALESSYWATLARIILDREEKGACPTDFPNGCGRWLLEQIENRSLLSVVDAALERAVSSSALHISEQATTIASTLLSDADKLSTCSVVGAMLRHSKADLQSLESSGAVTAEKAAPSCALSIATNVQPQDLPLAWGFSERMTVVLPLIDLAVRNEACEDVAGDLEGCIEAVVAAIGDSDLTSDGSAQSIADFGLPLVVENGSTHQVVDVVEAARVLFVLDEANVALCAALGTAPEEVRGKVLEALVPWRNRQGRSDCLVAFAKSAVDTGLLTPDEAWTQVVDGGLGDLAELDYLDHLINAFGDSCVVTGRVCERVSESQIAEIKIFSWSALRRIDDFVSNRDVSTHGASLIADGLWRYASEDPDGRTVAYYYCSIFHRLRPGLTEQQVLDLDALFPTPGHKVRCFADVAGAMASSDLEESWSYLGADERFSATTTEESEAFLRTRLRLFEETVRLRRCPPACMEDAFATLRAAAPDADLDDATWALAAVLAETPARSRVVRMLPELEFSSTAPCSTLLLLRPDLDASGVDDELAAAIRLWDAPDVSCWTDLFDLGHTVESAWDAQSQDPTAWRHHLPRIYALAIAEDSRVCGTRAACSEGLRLSVEELLADPSGAHGSLGPPEVGLIADEDMGGLVQRSAAAGLLSCPGLNALSDEVAEAVYLGNDGVEVQQECGSFVVNRLVPIDASAASPIVGALSNTFWRIRGLARVLELDGCEDSEQCWEELEHELRSAGATLHWVASPVLQTLIANDRDYLAIELVDQASEDDDGSPNNLCAAFDALYRIEPEWTMGIVLGWGGDFDHQHCFTALAQAIAEGFEGMNNDEQVEASLDLVGAPDSRLAANLLASIAFQLEGEAKQRLLRVSAVALGYDE